MCCDVVFFYKIENVMVVVGNGDVIFWFCDILWYFVIYDFYFGVCDRFFDSFNFYNCFF